MCFGAAARRRAEASARTALPAPPLRDQNQELNDKISAAQLKERQREGLTWARTILTSMSGAPSAYFGATPAALLSANANILGARTTLIGTA